MPRRVFLTGLVIILASCTTLTSTTSESSTRSPRAEKPLPLVERLSLSFGAESLYHKEREPDTATRSEAEVTNTVCGVEWLEHSVHLVDGIKAIIPLSRGDDQESWDSLGKHPYQTNTLEYAWTRVDGYIGYSFLEETGLGASAVLPATIYTGLRWSEAEQSRSDFTVLGNPVKTQGKEKIRSWGLLFGARGGNDLIKFNDSYGSVEKDERLPRWVWHWGIELIIPVYLKVTYSEMPGVAFRDKNGYTVEARVGLGCVLLKTLSLETYLYGGRIHWDGSNWKETRYGLVKWPENATDYLGGTLGLTLRF